MAKKDRLFPSIQYITKEGGLYVCGPDLLGSAQMGKEVEVGVYKLHDTIKIKCVVVKVD